MPSRARKFSNVLHQPHRLQCADPNLDGHCSQWCSALTVFYNSNEIAADSSNRTLAAGGNPRSRGRDQSEIQNLGSKSENTSL